MESSFVKAVAAYTMFQQSNISIRHNQSVLIETDNCSLAHHPNCIAVLNDLMVDRSNFTDNNNASVVNDCLLAKLNCISVLHAPLFKSSDIYKVVILLLIGVASIAGNVAVLTSIFKSKVSSSSMYVLLGHLAVADLLVALFALISEAIWTLTLKWEAGDITCKFYKYIQMFGLYLSVFTIVIISFDRFFAIRCPLRRSHMSKLVQKAMMVVWAICAVLSIPQAIIFNVEKGPFIEEFYQCRTKSSIAEWQMKVYTTFTFVIMFLIPLVTLIVTYTCTFYTISSSEKLFQRKDNDRRFSRMDSAREKVLHKAKIRSLMITVVIVLAFIICWTPYYIMMITFIYLKPDSEVMERMMAGIFFFGSSTALINPLVYGAFHLRRKRRGRHHMSNSSDNSAHMNLTMRLSRTNNTERLNMSSINGNFRYSVKDTPNRQNLISYDKSFLPTYSQSFL
ncbi:GPRGNR2 (predicted) [Pycnogonum litorale]